MKAYILNEEDFDKLLTAIDRDPQHGLNGGSSQVFSPVEKQAFETAHRFYNYQVRRWLDSVKK